MRLTKDFWEHLKTVGPQLGEPDDAHLGFLDDNSAVVTVEYVVPADVWDAFEKQWEAEHP